MAANNNNNNNNQLFSKNDLERSFTGVRGLTDGLRFVPQPFYHPESSTSDLPPPSRTIKLIDLTKHHNDVVSDVKSAARYGGVFQIVNHGVEPSVCDRLLASMRAFHESTTPESNKFIYGGPQSTGFRFFSNHDLRHSIAPSWRDSVFTPLNPIPNNVPNSCREDIIEWGNAVKDLGHRLVGLLSEGLEPRVNVLQDPKFMGRVSFFGNYYPYCPDPRNTIGFAPHTDPGLITVLLQDQVGGLQVKAWNNSWLKVNPTPGALVVLIGDFFQILSNDYYQSVEHRVLLTPNQPQVSTEVVFAPGEMDLLYGPLIKCGTQPKYCYFRFKDYYEKFYNTALAPKMMVNYYRSP